MKASGVTLLPKMKNVRVKLSDDFDPSVWADWLDIPRNRIVKLDTSQPNGKLGAGKFEERMNTIPFTTEQVRRLMTQDASEGFFSWVSAWKNTPMPVRILEQSNISSVCAVVVRGQSVPAGDFVFPVQINKFEPQQDLFGPPRIQQPGHSIAGIVRNNAVTLWDPNGQPWAIEHCIEQVVNALRTASGRALRVGDSSHPIYTFGPQQKFSSNSYCQSFTFLKIKDLATNGFPGKLEQELTNDVRDNPDLTTYVDKKFLFWDLAVGPHDHLQPWAGCNMALWSPAAYGRLAKMPDAKMQVWLSGDAVAAEATAGSFLIDYQIEPSEWLRLSDSATGRRLIENKFGRTSIDELLNSSEILEGLDKPRKPAVSETGGFDAKGRPKFEVTYNDGMFPFHSDYIVTSRKGIDAVTERFTIYPGDDWPKHFARTLREEATTEDILRWLVLG